MHIAEFNYELPTELIAQHPLPERDSSRMLVVDRLKSSWQDSHFAAFPDYVRKGDVVVINNTRVFPARLTGKRASSGGRVEILLVREVRPMVWEALVRPGNRLRQGSTIAFENSELSAEVLDEAGGEIRSLKFNSVELLEQIMETSGEMPLPPYIKRPEGGTREDRERYQTIFAVERGAIAAPTAGLHFTSAILQQLQQRGVSIVEITLHVGYGTFEPVRVENVAHHHVRPESFEITGQAAETINTSRSSGGRIIAVGTTTTRALESAVDTKGMVQAGRANAHLTITPGHAFRAIDLLLTNFHLPQSSLLLLVSAFAGRELILNAYRHSVEAHYRFYSYGDCMLII